MTLKIYNRKMGPRCTKTFYTTPQLIEKIQEIADSEKQYVNGTINYLLKLGIDVWNQNNDKPRFYIEDDVRYHDPEDGPLPDDVEINEEEKDRIKNPHLYD